MRGFPLTDSGIAVPRPGSNPSRQQSLGLWRDVMRPGPADDRDTRGRLLDARALVTLTASAEGQAAPIAVIAFLSSIGRRGQIGLSDRRTKIAGETEGKEG